MVRRPTCTRTSWQTSIQIHDVVLSLVPWHCLERLELESRLFWGCPPEEKTWRAGRSADPQKDDMHKSRSIPDEAAFEVLKKG